MSLKLYSVTADHDILKRLDNVAITAMQHEDGHSTVYCDGLGWSVNHSNQEDAVRALLEKHGYCEIKIVEIDLDGPSWIHSARI